MRNFDSFIKAFLDFTQYVEAPEKFLKWSAISVIAGALERRTWISFNQQQCVYPNEYIMLIGDAGLAKKSSSSGLAVSLLKEIEDLRFLSTQLTAASLVRQLQSSGAERTIELDGEKYVNSSIYLYSSEAAVTLKEITGGSIIELMTDFYDCGTAPAWSKTHYWSKETVSDGRFKIFNPCMNMLACSTPDWLVKSIGKDEIRGGFASRILFVVQKGPSGRTVGWMDEDELKAKDFSSMRSKLVGDLKQIAQLKGRFKTERSFGEAFNHYKPIVEQLIVDNKDKAMAGYYARKMWHALKLSQILAADKSNELWLSGEHFHQAMELLATIEPDMGSAFGTAGDNRHAQSLHLLWETIRTSQSVTRRDITNLGWKLAETKVIDEHIKTLIDMQRLHVTVSNGRAVYKIMDPTPLV